MYGGFTTVPGTILCMYTYYIGTYNSTMVRYYCYHSHFTKKEVSGSGKLNNEFKFSQLVSDSLAQTQVYMAPKPNPQPLITLHNYTRSVKKIQGFWFISPQTNLSATISICSNLNFPKFTSHKEEASGQHTFKGGFVGATQILTPGPRQTETGEMWSPHLPSLAWFLLAVLLRLYCWWVAGYQKPEHQICKF